MNNRNLRPSEMSCKIDSLTLYKILGLVSRNLVRLQWRSSITRRGKYPREYTDEGGKWTPKN